MSAVETRGYGRPLETMALLVARLKDAARMTDNAPLARELTRIADELLSARNALAERQAGTRYLGDPHRPGYYKDYRRNKRAAEKNPEPGMRHCSKCGALLPAVMFTVTDAETGKLRADCKPCYNQSQRSRYVKAGFRVVTVEVLDGDPCVGHLCPVCEKPFEPGQHVQGDNVRHAECAAA